MADFRFVKREDGFGEEAVDLHTCLLIRLSDPESGPDGELYHFYRTPTDQWIEHRGEPEYDEGKMNWSESISFVDKIVVAHVLLINKIYDGLLPNYLEECREIASDLNRYMKWRWPEVTEGEDDSRPRPVWENSQLSIAGRVIKKFRRDKTDRMKQALILDSFQAKGWRRSIISPFGRDIKLLEQTLVDMRQGLPGDCPIVFSRKNHEVTWAYREE